MVLNFRKVLFYFLFNNKVFGGVKYSVVKVIIYSRGKYIVGFSIVNYCCIVRYELMFLIGDIWVF